MGFLGRLLHFIRALICEWRGHDVEDWFPNRPLDLRPGHINYVPTPKLFVHLPVPDMPPDWILEQLPEERRQKIVETVMMLRLNPPIIVRSTYCRRCGEAW